MTQKISIDRALLEATLEKLASMRAELEAYRAIAKLVEEGEIDPEDIMEKVASYDPNVTIHVSPLGAPSTQYNSESIYNGIGKANSPEAEFFNSLSDLVKDHTH